MDHNHNFTVDESSLKELGFISPIKVFKGTGSGYFLRSSSKVLMDSVSSIGAGRLLSSAKFDESMEGIDRSDVFGELREVDSHLKGTL